MQALRQHVDVLSKQYKAALERHKDLGPYGTMATVRWNIYIYTADGVPYPHIGGAGDMLLDRVIVFHHHELFSSGNSTGHRLKHYLINCYHRKPLLTSIRMQIAVEYKQVFNAINKIYGKCRGI